MGTLTAQILVGSAHLYHGGINPSHIIYLSENDRPAWILVNEHIFSKKTGEKITWIPTLEHTLEDALLMIAIYAVKDSRICEMAKKFFGCGINHKLELYKDTKPQDREQLYQKCREIDFIGYGCKIVITILKGSSLQNAVDILKSYKIEAEICSSGV